MNADVPPEDDSEGRAAAGPSGVPGQPEGGPGSDFPIWDGQRWIDAAAKGAKRGPRPGEIEPWVKEAHRAWLEPLNCAYRASGMSLQAIVDISEITQPTHLSYLLRGKSPYPRWERVRSIAEALKDHLDLTEEELRQLWVSGARERGRSERWIHQKLRERRRAWRLGGSLAVAVALAGSLLSLLSASGGGEMARGPVGTPRAVPSLSARPVAPAPPYDAGDPQASPRLPRYIPADNRTAVLTVAFKRDTDVLTPRDSVGLTADVLTPRDSLDMSPVGTLRRRTPVGVECATADRDGTEYLKIANEARNYYVPENGFRITVTLEGLEDCYPLLPSGK
ncbi:hypothetical protein ACFYXF_33065 [Streptomyces sp. NPDC002680]|uniref:hypothetical protein n=1 Tax=Streptomyces sp. NPDC002680 TaxID=3364659 RepID=UPI0036960EC0